MNFVKDIRFSRNMQPKMLVLQTCEVRNLKANGIKSNATCLLLNLFKKKTNSECSTL